MFLTIFVLGTLSNVLKSNRKVLHMQYTALEFAHLALPTIIAHYRTSATVVGVAHAFVLNSGNGLQLKLRSSCHGTCLAVCTILERDITTPFPAIPNQSPHRTRQTAN